MRIKIKDVWFDVTPDTPIMVELTKEDKNHINNMLPSATKYACFSDSSPLNSKQKSHWMKT